MNLEDKLTQYRDLQIELKPILEQLKALEREIKAEVLDTGQLPDVEGIKVQLRKGYTRSTWDNKLLRGYAVAHPEILEFVKETQVRGSVSLKVL